MTTLPTHPLRLVPMALGVVGAASASTGFEVYNFSPPSISSHFSPTIVPDLERGNGSTLFSTAELSWLSITPATWLNTAFARVDAYDDVENGWKGEDFLAPSSQTIAEAKELLEQFAVDMPALSEPMISADSDGSICLHWREPPMMATVTAHGDGTYSFYAEGYGRPARSDSEQIGSPLPRTLVLAMVEGLTVTNGAA